MTETGAESGPDSPDASGRTGPPVGAPGQQADTESATPPYEGRTTEGADAEDIDEPEERKQRFAGVPDATRGSRTEEPTDPDTTPGGRTASPADEQPAGAEVQTRDSDPGVGPAHHPGTTRGEDVADRQDEPGRTDEGTKGESGRPVGSSTSRDATTVDPQESGD